jgi:hypothetical protein
MHLGFTRNIGKQDGERKKAGEREKKGGETPANQIQQWSLLRTETPSAFYSTSSEEASTITLSDIISPCTMVGK